MKPSEKGQASAGGFSLADQRRFIASIAPDYVQDRWRQREKIRKELEILPPASTEGWALELGAGGGVVLDLLGEAGWKAVGVEVVGEMIHRAAEQTSQPLVQADGIQLPFRNNTFSLITLWGNTLGPIPGQSNRVALLSEAKRVLTEEGVLALSVLNRTAGVRRMLRPVEGMFHYVTKATGARSPLQGYNRYYSLGRVKQELKLAGFTSFRRLSSLRASSLVLLCK